MDSDLFANLLVDEIENNKKEKWCQNEPACESRKAETNTYQKECRETTDFVASEETPENRIIPDAAFVLENLETDRRGLFFVEMDMATERIVTKITHDRRATLHHKFEQYDRYLTGGRYRETYKQYGEFRHFILLFVTYGEERIDNILHAVSDLPADLHPY